MMHDGEAQCVWLSRCPTKRHLICSTSVCPHLKSSAHDSCPYSFQSQCFHQTWSPPWPYTSSRHFRLNNLPGCCLCTFKCSLKTPASTDASVFILALAQGNIWAIFLSGCLRPWKKYSPIFTCSTILSNRKLQILYCMCFSGSGSLYLHIVCVTFLLSHRLQTPKMPNMSVRGVAFARLWHTQRDCCNTIN